MASTGAEDRERSRESGRGQRDSPERPTRPEGLEATLSKNQEYNNQRMTNLEGQIAQIGATLQNLVQVMMTPAQGTPNVATQVGPTLDPLQQTGARLDQLQQTGPRLDPLQQRDPWAQPSAPAETQVPVGPVTQPPQGGTSGFGGVSGTNLGAETGFGSSLGAGAIPGSTGVAGAGMTASGFSSGFAGLDAMGPSPIAQVPPGFAGSPFGDNLTGGNLQFQVGAGQTQRPVIELRDVAGIPIPLSQAGNSGVQVHEKKEDDNPFRRSEKWMPGLPSPDHGKWKSRPEEVEGFQRYIHNLASWGGYGSNEYPREILYSVRHPSKITWSNMSPGMITRSVRLMSIVKHAFQDHPKAALILNNYEESMGHINCCGFEALRLLGQEFCVKTRTELLFFRQRVSNGTFSGASIPETVRMVEAELFRFERLRELVDNTVSSADLCITEADKILVLLRSLPNGCRQFLTLHVVDQSFKGLCEGALRYESQQRTWAELNSKPIVPFSGKGKDKDGKGKDGKGKNKGKNKGNEQKGKGKSKSSGKDGSTETRTCFQCGQRGHLSADCPDRNGSTGGANSPGGKSQKGKGKKGKGKVGKRATELTENAADGAASETWSEIGDQDQGTQRLSTFGIVPGPKFVAGPNEHAQCFDRDLQRHAVPRFRQGMVLRFFAWMLLVVNLIFMCIRRPKLPVDEQFQPFLNSAQFPEEEHQFWIIDSGASRTVIGEQHLKHYKILRQRELDHPLVFGTADGNLVACMSEVFIEVKFRVWGEDKLHWQRFEIRAVVGPVSHNLLSVSQLARSGNEFVFNADECYIHMNDWKKIPCLIWCGVPWLEAKTKSGKTGKGFPYAPMEVDKSEDVEMQSAVKLHDKCSSDSSTPASPIRSLPSALKHVKPTVQFQTTEVVAYSDGEIGEVLSVSEVERPDWLDSESDIELPLPDDPGIAEQVGAGAEDEAVVNSDFPKLQQRVKQELILHRRRGHIPFDSRCTHCVNTRSVVRHSRGADERTNLGPSAYLIQADFFFIGSKGRKDKFLALAEAMTGLVGVAYVGSNVESTIAEAKKFFGQLGLLNLAEATPVEVLTDAEDGVRTLLEKIPCRLTIKQASPQSHQTVGRVERSIRRFKEIHACIAEDLKSHGWMLKDDATVTRQVLQYVAQTHNHFGTGAIEQDGNRRSPLELCNHKNLPSIQSTVFGAMVFAQVTDAVRERLAVGNRFVLASYRYPDVGGLGHVVRTLTAGGEPLTFTTNIRPMDKICWDASYAGDIVVRCDGLDPRAIEDVPPVLGPRTDHEVPVDERPRHNGPPIAWVKEHGPTEGCTACNAASRRGKNHSAKCKRRYDDWLKTQRAGLESPPDQVNAPIADSSGPSNAAAGSSSSQVRPEHPSDGRRMHGKQPPSNPGYRGNNPGNVQNDPDEEPDVSMHPETGGAMDDDDDDMSLYSPTSPVNSDIANERDLDDMSVSGMAETLRHAVPIWERLTDVPTTENQGVLFPYYIPRKGEEFESAKYTLCGEDVFLVRPVATISEDGGDHFTVEEAEAGRKTELDAMNRVKFGRLMSEEDARRLAAERHAHVIGSRWVLTRKQNQEGKTICRARCVAQQVAHGASASNLGISSSTPSLESLRAVLAAICMFNLMSATLDISAAFLNSPLPANVTAILRLPADVSWSQTSQVPVCADLRVAVNGLRAASKAWLSLCTSLCKSVGLVACASEVTVLAGRLHKAQTGCIALVYVDDIILAGTEDGIQEVADALSTRVQVKMTGKMSNSGGEGGKLHFLGRDIVREPYSEQLKMRVPPEYLRESCNEFGDLKPTQVPPNLQATLDKASKSPDSNAALTEEAAARYRRILGRVGWWAQSRPDQAKFVSLLAQGQKSPNQGFEHALRQYMRYLKGIAHQYNVFPTEYRYSQDQDGLVAVCDAAWGERSTTGCAIYWMQCLLKGISRLQTSTSLSSCEAEIIGCCQTIQETMALNHLTEFLANFQNEDKLWELSGNAATSIHDLNFEEHKVESQIQVYSDSESCIAVLRNDGLHRRVRHLNLSVCYIQGLLAEGLVRLHWLPTAECVADCLTKILGTEAMRKHQLNLGVMEITGPEEWQLQSNKRVKNEPNAQMSNAVAQHPYWSCPTKQKLDKNWFDFSSGWTVPPMFPVFDGEMEDLKRSINECFEPSVKVILLDICTTKRAGFSQLQMDGIKVLAVTAALPISGCHRLLERKLKMLAETKHVVVWLSPPCTGGSPVLNLTPEPRRTELIEHYQEQMQQILDDCNKLMSLANIRVLEFSKACSFWTLKQVRDFLERFKMNCQVDVARCAFVNGDELRAKHEYRLLGNIEFQQDVIPQCQCERHLSLNHQNLKDLGEYPVKFSIWIAEIMMKHLDVQVTIRPKP